MMASVTRRSTESKTKRMLHLVTLKSTRTGAFLIGSVDVHLASDAVPGLGALRLYELRMFTRHNFARTLTLKEICTLSFSNTTTR